MDVFKEQIVKRKPTMLDSIKRAGLIFVVVAVAFTTFAVPGLNVFAPIIIIAVGFGAFYLNAFLNVEYEYVFTSGDLDIDAIYDKRRRKRLFSARVNDIDIMAPIEDTVQSGSFNNASETNDYSSGVAGPDTYAFMINLKGKRVKIIFEPNDKMMDTIKGSMSRNKLQLRK